MKKLKKSAVLDVVLTSTACALIYTRIFDSHDVDLSTFDQFVVAACIVQVACTSAITFTAIVSDIIRDRCKSPANVTSRKRVVDGNKNPL